MDSSSSPRCCAGVLVFFSVLLMILFFPFSLFLAVKVCAYNNAYYMALDYCTGDTRISKIFRLGRVEDGDAKAQVT